MIVQFLLALHWNHDLKRGIHLKGCQPFWKWTFGESLVNIGSPAPPKPDVQQCTENILLNNGLWSHSSHGKDILVILIYQLNRNQNLKRFYQLKAWYGVY